MLTNDELDRLEIDADSPQAMPAKASVLALVGELRAERTRTETLRVEFQEFVDAVGPWLRARLHQSGKGVVPPSFDESLDRARAALAASVEETPSP